MTIKKLLAACALSAFAPLSIAAIIASENFDYNSGELNQKTGGTGWAGAWVANASVTQVVTPGVTLNGGNALQISGNNNNAAYRPLESAFSGNSLYVSFYVQVQSGSFTANDFVGLWLDVSNTGAHTARPNIGIKADGNGSNDVFVRTSGTGGVFAPNSNIGSTIGVTSHIVGLLSRSGSGNYDSFAMWLNPALGDLNTPDAIMTGPTGISQVSYIGFRSANLDSGDALLIDGLQLSTTWKEALRVPEPGTVALLGLGLLGLCLIKKRKA